MYDTRIIYFTQKYMNKKIKEKIEDLIVLIAGAIIWISFLYAIGL